MGIIKESHDLGKPVRFWAIPDFKEGWNTLFELGIDIINTDQVGEASQFVSGK